MPTPASGSTQPRLPEIDSRATAPRWPRGCRLPQADGRSSAWADAAPRVPPTGPLSSGGDDQPGCHREEVNGGLVRRTRWQRPGDTNAVKKKMENVPK